MFFAHKLVVFALSGDLNDPQHFQKVYRRLVTDRPDEEKKALSDQYPAALKRFLQEDLPPLAAVKRIRRRLARLAKEHGALIRDVHWWEIRPKLRAVAASLTRDGRMLAVHFYWKKTVKSEANPLNRGCRALCYTDATRPGGLCLEFDAESYQDMRTGFEVWLTRPFNPPPLSPSSRR